MSKNIPGLFQDNCKELKAQKLGTRKPGHKGFFKTAPVLRAYDMHWKFSSLIY